MARDWQYTKPSLSIVRHASVFIFWVPAILSGPFVVICYLVLFCFISFLFVAFAYFFLYALVGAS